MLGHYPNLARIDWLIKRRTLSDPRLYAIGRLGLKGHVRSPVVVVRTNIERR